jgi:hypothetical protein
MLVNRGDDGDFRTRIVGRLTRVKSNRDAMALNAELEEIVILFNRHYGVPVTIPSTINGIRCFMQPKKGNSCKPGHTIISRNLCRYEPGTEKDGADPTFMEGVYDDLHQYCCVYAPDREPKLRKSLANTSISGVEHSVVSILGTMPEHYPTWFHSEPVIPNPPTPGQLAAMVRRVPDSLATYMQPSPPRHFANNVGEHLERAIG